MTDQPRAGHEHVVQFDCGCRTVADGDDERGMGDDAFCAIHGEVEVADVINF